MLPKVDFAAQVQMCVRSLDGLSYRANCHKLEWVLLSHLHRLGRLSRVESTPYVSVIYLLTRTGCAAKVTNGQNHYCVYSEV